MRYGQVAKVSKGRDDSRLLLLCEHASNDMPLGLERLGMSDEVLNSHAAWDIGAFGLTQALSEGLKAPYVAGTISRLAYDCNRPPEAHDAIPVQSEMFTIVGNHNLSQKDRQDRIDGIYRPFVKAVNQECLNHAPHLKLLVTVHSFTPVYHKQTRDVEIGILHGKDSRFANAMMQHYPADCPYTIRLNEPYSAQDGVAHSLDLYGSHHKLDSVMLEIRNDLLQKRAQQEHMAHLLTSWLNDTVRHVYEERAVS